MADYQRTTVRETDGELDGPTTVTVVRRNSGMVLLERLVWLLFGILQAAILLRIGLLLLAANQSNDIVRGLLTFTDAFVDPFRGILRIDRIATNAGSVLDVAAIVALIGWSLIEALVLAILRLFDRRVGPA